MTDLEKLKEIKEYFDGLALYFKDQTKEYKHPEDIDPKDFVVCLPIAKPKTLKELRRSDEY